MGAFRPGQTELLCCSDWHSWLCGLEHASMALELRSSLLLPTCFVLLTYLVVRLAGAAPKAGGGNKSLAAEHW